jgi:hypothetical protein
MRPMTTAVKAASTIKGTSFFQPPGITVALQICGRRLLRAR